MASKMTETTLKRNRTEFIEFMYLIVGSDCAMFSDRLFNEMSVKEIALKHNTSISVVTSTLHRARKTVEKYAQLLSMIKIRKDVNNDYKNNGRT